MVEKNEGISESVNSIESGAIFLPRSGQELSRDVFVVLVYAFDKKLYRGMCFCMIPKNRDFREKIEFSARRPLFRSYSGRTGYISDENSIYGSYGPYVSRKSPSL